MKRFLLTTAILIAIPTLIFIPSYAIMIYSATVNAKDYSEDILGQWTAIQYYYDNQLTVCNDQVGMSVTFDGSTIVVEGNVLPQTRSSYAMESGTSLSYQVDGETYTFLLSFDSFGHLVAIVDGTPYIIFLRKIGV